MKAVTKGGIKLKTIKNIITSLQLIAKSFIFIKNNLSNIFPKTKNIDNEIFKSKK